MLTRKHLLAGAAGVLLLAAPVATIADGNDKEKARLNIIRAILDRVPYEFNEAAFEPLTLPPRPERDNGDYQEPALEDLNLIKDYYSD